MNATAFLRRSLAADAAVSGAAGLLMAGAAAPLHEWLGLPMALLRVAGLGLLPFALALVLLSRRTALPAPAVWAVIAGNALWALASALALLVLRPSPLGSAFVLVQALVVAAFAELQYVGLHKAAAAEA